MAEARRTFDGDFKRGAVRLVRETGKPIARVARELGVNEGTLGNWCGQDRRRHGDGALSANEREELRQLRKENADADLRAASTRALRHQGPGASPSRGLDR